jgi:hypothetical protein
MSKRKHVSTGHVLPDPAPGCVPHLPTPADWPQKPVGDPDGCAPPKGLLEQLSALFAGRPVPPRRKRP